MYICGNVSSQISSRVFSLLACVDWHLDKFLINNCLLALCNVMLCNYKSLRCFGVPARISDRNFFAGHSKT